MDGNETAAAAEAAAKQMNKHVEEAATAVEKKKKRKSRSASKEADNEAAADNRGTSSKKPKAVPISLPEGHQRLLDLFVAVDHAYCFLSKNSIPPKVCNIQSMVWRLFPGRFGDEASFLPRLKRIAAVGHTFVVLEEPPDDQVDDEYNPDTEDYYNEVRRLELRFPHPKTAGIGKLKVAKRQQLMRQALAENTEGTSPTRGNSNARSAGAGPTAASTTAGAAPASAATGSPPQSSATASASAKSGTDGGASGGIEKDDDFVASSSSNKTDRAKKRGNSGRKSKRKTTAEDEGQGETAGTCTAAVAAETAVPDGEGHDGRDTDANHAVSSTPGAATTGASTRRSRKVRARPQANSTQAEKQQGTGTAISIFAPLSDSPAYVVAGRDEGRPDGGAEEQELPEEEAGSFLPEEKLRFDPGLALAHLQSLPFYNGQAVYTETLPGREGEFADTAVPLHPQVVAALMASKGVFRLFKHQALAIDAAMRGQHVALSTATSSGKSVVFNVSVLESIVGERPGAVALYLFPTKALAQDQLRSLKELVECSPYLRERVRPMTLDGDTPFGERGHVFEEANIVLTNPDMLHASVLPGHKRFRRILGDLSHVVIDEAHVYRGAFGAHVSMVLRRLLRLWAVNAEPGPPPQFICCSATMRDPPAHFASLLPLEECLGGRKNLYFGSADTAPTGRKTFVLWRPPIVAEWFNFPAADEKGDHRAGVFDSGRGGGGGGGGCVEERGLRASSEATVNDNVAASRSEEGGGRATIEGVEEADEEGTAGGVRRAAWGSGGAKGKGKGKEKDKFLAGADGAQERKGAMSHSSEEEDKGDQAREQEGVLTESTSFTADGATATGFTVEIEEREKGRVASGEKLRRQRSSSGSSPPLRTSKFRRKRRSMTRSLSNGQAGGNTPNSDGGIPVTGSDGTPSSGRGTEITKPRLEGWRKGPTDNYYNREYMKLMGAELPRPPLRRSSTTSSGGDDQDQQEHAVVDRGRRESGGGGAVQQPEAPHVSSTKNGENGKKGEDNTDSVERQTNSDNVLPVHDCERASAVGSGVGAAEGAEDKRGTLASKISSEAGSLTPAPAIVVSLRQAGAGGSLEVAKVTAVPAAPASLEKAAVAQAGAHPTAMPPGKSRNASARSAESGEQEAGVGQARNDEGVQGENGGGWEDGRRRSPICETANILIALVKQRVKTLAFCRTRKLTELTLRYGRQDLERTAPQLTSLVQGYRGGYTKGERRTIEGRLFANKLLGVTATCALELGVDIGELDVTLHLGFPGSVSSLRQQSGRAGRGGKDSLSVMVLFQDPISQFFVRNPEELLHKDPEAAVLDADNELVLSAHLLCAAAECPLGVPNLGGVNDAALFGGQQRLREVIDTMSDGDFPRLIPTAGDLGWKANPGLDPPPCRRVGLRMIDPITFSVVDDLKDGEAYDSVEYSRAFFTLFEGAIYLHQARQFLVTRLDLRKHVAHTRPVKVNYYTAARNNVDVKVTKRLEVSEDGHAHTGCVDVVATVFGFVKKQMGTGMTIERRECSLPPLQYATRAFWLDVGPTAKANVEEAGRDFEGGIHAIGHALLAVVPLFLLCDSSDVDCEHARPYHNRPKPQRILVFDKRPGGVGVSDAMFGCHRAVLCKALELVEGCPCPDGCLACIHEHTCTGYNAIIDKEAALIILKGLIRDMMDISNDNTEYVSSTDDTVGSKTADTSTHNGDTETIIMGRRRTRRNLGQSESEDGIEDEARGYFLGSDGPVDNDDSMAKPPSIGGDVMGGGGSGHDEGGTIEGRGEVLISPRKKQRLRNLRLAKGMGTAREKDIAVVPRWIPSVP